MTSSALRAVRSLSGTVAVTTGSRSAGFRHQPVGVRAHQLRVPANQGGGEDGAEDGLVEPAAGAVGIVATRLGARPLVRAIESPAQRTRIRLETADLPPVRDVPAVEDVRLEAAAIAHRLAMANRRT